MRGGDKTGLPESRSDPVTIEEPLEIRIDDSPVAVAMRTPGDDFELVAGFLLTEDRRKTTFQDVAGVDEAKEEADLLAEVSERGFGVLS